MNRNDRSISSFTMIAHAVFHTYELSIPVFVVVWLSYFSVSEAALGLALGAAYALIGIGAPLSGALSDAYGSKTLVVVSMTGMAAGFGFLSIAPTFPTLVAALVLWGAAASLYHPAGLSLISRGSSRRGSVLAYHGAAGNVGTVVGPLITIVLLLYFDWRTVAAVLVVPAVLAVLAGVRLDFEESVDGDDEHAVTDTARIRAQFDAWLEDSRTLLTAGFVLVFAIQMIYGMYYRGLLTFLPDVLGRLPFDPVAVGERSVDPGEYLYSGLLLVGVFGQMAGGFLTERYPTGHVLSTGFIVLTIATLAFVPAAAVGVTPLLLVCTVIGFCLYVVVPVIQAAIADHTPAALHGLSFGYVYFGMFGLGATGATVAGAVLTYAGLSTLFSVLAGITVICAVLAAYLAVRTGRITVDEPTRP